jgi:hypothetical protein
MLFIFSVQGEQVNRVIFRGKINTAGEIILLGMVLQTLIVTIVAFFYRIHIEYFCCNTLVSIILAVSDKNWFLRLKKGLQWDKFCILLFALIVVLSLIRSSLLPFIIDNESYYIQTIKWLNEYGWVKGLANLHVFLANGSPWHALQAAYNFNFISGIFNDLNGFFMCVASFLWLDKINLYRRNADYQSNRWLFFLPLFSIFWFHFVDSPSADLPLFLITLVVVYHVLNRSEEGNLLAIFLLVFLVFIKLSIAPILILWPFLFTKKNRKIAIPYTLILGFIYLFKGIWLSGCPLAPYTGFSISLPWTIPSGLEIVEDKFNFNSIGSNDFLNLSLAFIVISTFVVYTCAILKKKEQYPVCLFFTLQIAWILFTYTQFRYILPALFFPLAYLLSKIKLSSKLFPVVTYFFILSVLIPIFFHFDYGKLNQNSRLLGKNIFQTRYILQPAGISKHKNMTFKKASITNINYFNPVDDSGFLFLTGNGPLPCVKTDYLYHMYLTTHCSPALFDETDFGKGFYSYYFDPEDP